MAVDLAGPKRVKIPLTLEALHRLLGLPDDVRVVGLLAVEGAQMHVLIEGDSLPATATLPGGPPNETLAALGYIEAPYVWHPVQGGGGGGPALRWGDWKPGDQYEPGYRWTIGAREVSA